MTSQFKYNFEGKEISQEELISFVRDSSPERRKNAYLALFSRYKEHKDVIGEIYKNIVLDWQEENVGLRGYSNVINVRNVVNDIPDKAVDALLKVCEKNQTLFHRFFELKRKKLGLKKMRRFDLYAPLSEEKKNISYDKAMNLVLQSFEGFSPRFKEEALAIINARHVHSTIQENKQTGAYCMSVNAKLEPYVLLNYTGKLRDVSTIAHELGHGIHHQLAREHTEYTFHSALPLAETASIFGEMLLTEKMFQEDPSGAQALLFAKVDDIYASIIRQAGFVSFERKAHQMMKEGKTIQEMCNAYLADLRTQLGPKVEVDELFAYEWTYIPHIFHTPFYCYAYAFGNLLTLALWEMYKEDTKVSGKIIEMLAMGGSASPIEITRKIGVDITSEDFWQKGFMVIEKMIKELEN